MTYQMVFSAWADPTRRTIFEQVAKSPSPVGALADTLPISRPAVSQHLKVLSDAGLVQVQASGTRRIYSANPESLQDLRSWLDTMWEYVLSAFADAAKKESKA